MQITSPTLACPRIASRALPARQSRWPEAVGPPIVALTLALFITWMWRRSLDPVIDFGRELYTPWQLSRGRTLYTDIAAFYGPLSQYVNALFFRIFGPTLLTLMIVNSAILTVATGLVYGILRSLSTRVAATVGGVMFVTMFGAAHVGAVGNFNFLTPYSHEATHGFVLSVAALLAYIQWMKSERTRWAALVGLCAGCVFLTKPEIFVALIGALAVGIAGMFWARRRAGRALIAMLAAMLAGPGLMLIFLWTQMPIRAAAGGILGAWRCMSNSALVGNAFYANSMGLESPRKQAGIILLVVARAAALLAPALLVALVAKGSGRWRWGWALVAGIVMAAAVGGIEGLDWWASAGEMLMLATAGIAIWQAAAIVRRRDGLATRQLSCLAVCAFALLMLLKMFLHTRFHQYGFVLAAMATMVFTMALLDWLPALLEQRGRDGWMLRGASLVLLGMLVVVSVTVSARNLAQQSYTIGDGGDSFLIDDRGPIFSDMIHYIRAGSRADETLTVLPEGIMLNVLTARRSAIPYLSTIPSDLTMFGEKRIEAALAHGRPDFLAIVDRPTADFGQERFGTDYAVGIRNWAMANYHPVHLSGAIPFTGDHFGILLLQRNAPTK